MRQSIGLGGGGSAERGLLGAVVVVLVFHGQTPTGVATSRTSSAYGGDGGGDEGKDRVGGERGEREGIRGGKSGGAYQGGGGHLASSPNHHLHLRLSGGDFDGRIMVVVVMGVR